MGPVVVLSVSVEMFAQWLLKEEYNTMWPEDISTQRLTHSRSGKVLDNKDLIKY